jgi:hypothetical protein
MLWHMTAEFTPQGDIGKYDDDWIEASLEWHGRKGYLVDCLVEAGFLDREPATTKGFVDDDEEIRHRSPEHRKLFVHHWHDHAEDSVRKRLNRAGLQFLTVSGKVTGQNPVSDRTLSDTGAGLPSQALAKPEPLPPKPPVCASTDARVDDESPPPKRPQPATGYDPAWFDEWWKIYWRRVSKKPAEKAFKAAVRTEERFRQVMAATRNQTPEMIGRDEKMRPHGATWLREERWNDEPSAPARVGPQQSLLYPDLPKMKEN